MQRAEKSVNKAHKRELEAIEKQLLHLQAKRFESQEQAQSALVTRSRSWRYHQVATTELIEHKYSAGKGRPSAKTPIKSIDWHIRVQVCPDAEAIWSTLRWVFQLLEGIHRVRVIVQDQIHDLIEGLNEVQIKILRLFGQDVCQIYQISSG